MGLKWVDSLDIAIELHDKFPDVDPMHVNFVDLRNWVLELDEFLSDLCLVVVVNYKYCRNSFGLWFGKFLFGEFFTYKVANRF